MKIGKMLPRGVGAWCFQCNGLVAIAQYVETTQTGRFMIRDGKRIEWMDNTKTVMQGYCAKCGAEVETDRLPFQAIDRLRMIAEMIHAEEKE